MKEDFTRLFPDNRTAGETPLRQAQLVMLRTLRIIDHICRKHGIPYWLAGGTLIGAARHKGFIPWDDDLDIAMRREDFARFAAVAPRELPDDLFFQTAATDPHYRLVLPKVRDRKSNFVEDREDVPFCQGIYVDIFPFDAYPNQAVLRLLSLRHRLRGYRRRFPKRSIGRTLYMAGLFTLGLPLILFLYLVEWTARRFRDRLFNRPDQKYLSPGVEFYRKMPHEADEIFPLREISFEGFMFFAPRDTDTYLRKQYGDYMTMPPVNQRQTHARRIVVDTSALGV